MTRTFRYVPFSRLDSYLRAGWRPSRALVGCHHGEHAVLCEAPGWRERVRAFLRFQRSERGPVG